MPPPLILASTSPYRRALMERLGIPFSFRAPMVDEEDWRANRPQLSPRDIAECLARAKAESIFTHEPQAVVIGCDQLVSFEGQVLGKPGSAAAAAGQLESMSGRSHELITAMAVRAPGRLVRHTEVATLHFRALSTEEIERYVATDHPIDCAGAYKLESRGIVLFERIACDDHSAITGLPLMALTTVLRDLGYTLP